MNAAEKTRLYPPVERPKPFRQDSEFLRLKRLAKELEKTAGDGREIGGSGLTILKFEGSPLSRLFDKDKIGTDELRAAEDIQTAYFSLTSSLWIRSQNYEKTDKTNNHFEPYAVVDAVKRYKSWADHWSARSKRGDKTLKIVIEAVVDERPLRQIERDNEIRSGQASIIIPTALRDYLARAGWADSKQAKDWIEAAESNFKLRAR